MVLSAPGARDKWGSRRGLSSTYDTTGAQASGIRGCHEVGVRPGERLATREAVEEVIVIDSDSDSDSDDGDGDGDGIGPSAEPAPALAPLPLPVPSAGLSLNRVPVEGQKDRTSTADSLTPQRRFSGFWDLVESKTPTNKTGSLASGPSGLFVKDTYTPSARAPHGSLGSTYTPKPMLSGKIASVKVEKTDINVRVSRQKPVAAASATTTAITAIAHTRNGTLPRHSSPVLPPTLPPAVKARVYSAPRSGARRSINRGSKKLEAFGFVSAASLVAAGTATTTTRNASTITPTPIPKPSSISKPIVKPIKKEVSRLTEVVRTQSRNLQSSPRTTHDASTAVTPIPIAKPKHIAKPIHRETVKVEASNLRPLPRTPENPTATKRAAVLSSSIGTYGDPYAISSDSDSGSDGNGELRSVLSVKSLNSFAETASAYETASDVEAVLNQFPAWLDSPIPPEHRSSYLATPTTTRPTANARPTTTLRSSRRLWDYGDKNESREGKEKRRIRFAGGDGFSPSPVPTKRVASPAKRFTSPLAQPTSPANGITTSSRLASPIKPITSTKRIAILDRSSPAPARQVASHIEPINGPVKKITVFGVDPNSNGHINLNSNYNHNHNQEQDQDQDQEHPVIRENTPPPKEKDEKKKKRKKRKVRSSGNKTSCRYRNHNRETWRPKERRKVKRDSI